MSDAKPVKVGDEVRVFDGPRSVLEGGRKGEVTRVGRTLIDVTYDNGQIQTFRLDTQHSNDKQYGYGVWFQTVEQAEAASRRARAFKTLRELGINVQRAADFSTEQIEAVVETVRRF